MYYHGSPLGNLKYLEPRISMHGKKYIYFSINIAHAMLYTVRCNFYPYGFNSEDGTLEYTEYFKNCLATIYEKQTGYIYSVDGIDAQKLPGIRNAYVLSNRVEVSPPERVEDVYRKFLDYEKANMIFIRRYESLTDAMKNSIRKQMVQEIIKEKLLGSISGYSLFIRKYFPDAWLEAEKSAAATAIKGANMPGSDTENSV